MYIQVTLELYSLQVGSRTNIGAGTITCNFDGVGKNATRIGDDAFIGSNSTLVAPVHVGDKSVVAAGSVVVDNAPTGSVVFGRARQTTKDSAADKLQRKFRARHGKQPT